MTERIARVRKLEARLSAIALARAAARLADMEQRDAILRGIAAEIDAPAPSAGWLAARRDFVARVAAAREALEPAIADARAQRDAAGRELGRADHAASLTGERAQAARRSERLRADDRLAGLARPPRRIAG